MVCKKGLYSTLKNEEREYVDDLWINFLEENPDKMVNATEFWDIYGRKLIHEIWAKNRRRMSKRDIEINNKLRGMKNGNKN